MKTEIVIYDQKLADAVAGAALCLCQTPPPTLDIGPAGKNREFRHPDY
jgi:hypothetical protein